VYIPSPHATSTCGVWLWLWLWLSRCAMAMAADAFKGVAQAHGSHRRSCSCDAKVSSRRTTMHDDSCFCLLRPRGRAQPQRRPALSVGDFGHLVTRGLGRSAAGAALGIGTARMRAFATNRRDSPPSLSQRARQHRAEKAPEQVPIVFPTSTLKLGRGEGVGKGAEGVARPAYCPSREDARRGEGDNGPATCIRRGSQRGACEQHQRA
jgi:hypothetical protein